MTVVLTSAENVATEIVRRMKLVTVAQGAETDIGATVYQGLRRVDDSMIPCCVLIEGVDQVQGANLRADVNLDQRYVLFGYLPCDSLNPNVAAHAAIRDLKRAIFTTAGVADSRWGFKVREVSYLGRDIGPRADGAAFVLAAIEISVGYAESLANP